MIICRDAWADSFQKTGTLPIHRQGVYAKKESLIRNEDIAQQCRTIFRSMPRNTRTAKHFLENIRQQMPSIDICERTASTWLHSLGFEHGDLKKGVYIDGHERPDVIEARIHFLKEMEKFQSRMYRFTGVDREITIQPHCIDGELPMIWVVHDESVFDSSGGRLKVWTEEGHPALPPKRGQSLHVSGLISPLGVINMETMVPGKNKDGYWTNRDLINQLERELPIFSEEHPGHIGVFQFDNSQNHHVHAPDALVQRRLMLSNGLPRLTESDKAAGMAPTAFRNTTWNDANGAIHQQSIW